MFKMLTKNYTQVPLFYVDFNLQKYINEGAKNSCEAKIHPSLKGDDFIKEKLGEIINYIRDNYDMGKISK